MRRDINEFSVHGHHDRYFPVALPKWLPREVLEHMVETFSSHLRQEIRKALAAKGSKGKHNHTSSAQSEASVSSGSIDVVGEDLAPSNYGYAFHRNPF
jgi:hypothetical protein